ncbi:hypothetical protein AGMMS49543_18020 [Betaproteobacteria bacterium]|nr:hypothetical protein AGMMS49543_18020 [Betaproteobacteria bacterium]GHU15742.1 hypothetical protein AGMMS50243_00030 [Betaproteobacteria bacterium]
MNQKAQEIITDDDLESLAEMAGEITAFARERSERARERIAGVMEEAILEIKAEAKQMPRMSKAERQARATLEEAWRALCAAEGERDGAEWEMGTHDGFVIWRKAAIEAQFAKKYWTEAGEKLDRILAKEAKKK